MSNRSEVGREIPCLTDLQWERDTMSNRSAVGERDTISNRSEVGREILCLTDLKWGERYCV